MQQKTTKSNNNANIHKPAFNKKQTTTTQGRFNNKMKMQTKNHPTKIKRLQQIDEYERESLHNIQTYTNTNLTKDNKYDNNKPIVYKKMQLN